MSGQKSCGINFHLIELQIKFRGKQLGEIVSAIRCRGAFSDFYTELVELGFYFNKRTKEHIIELSKKVTNKNDDNKSGIDDSSKKKRPLDKPIDDKNLKIQKTNQVTWETLLSALEVYKEKNGDLRVNQLFVVPSDTDQWPDKLWGIRLGYLVSLIRNNNAYADYKEELLELGFDYNKQSKRRYSVGSIIIGTTDEATEGSAKQNSKPKKLVHKLFRNNNDHKTVNKVGVVDRNDLPKKGLGKSLLQPIINKAKEEKIVKESATSAKKNSQTSNEKVRKFWEETKLALLIYKRIERNLLVPQKFVIPHDEEPWPESLWYIIYSINNTIFF